MREFDVLDEFLSEVDPDIYGDPSEVGVLAVLEALEDDGVEVPGYIWDAFEERKRAARAGRGRRVLMDSMAVHMGADTSDISTLRRD